MTTLHQTLPATLSDADVRCFPEAVEVHRLIVRDRMVVDYYAAMQGECRASSARDAFVIGTRALAAAGGSATMAALDDRLHAAVRAAGQTLTALPETVNVQIEALCARYLGENGEFVRNLGKDLASVGAVLGADGHIVAAMRDAIAVDVRRRVTEALAPIAQALNVNDASGPLGLMQRTLQEVKLGQGEIRELVNGAIRLQTQRGVSVHKGYDLEDFIEISLGELAAALGDRFENCSRSAGFVPNVKEGDFLSTVDSRLTHGCDARIVVEAKNRCSDTVAGLCRLLDSARRNRGAIVGVGVLTNPKAATNPIALYEADKIVVHLPGFGVPGTDVEAQRTLLGIAYSVARLQTVALANATPVAPLDAAVVGAHLDRLVAAAKRFSDLNRNFTAIETAVKTARTTADATRAEFDDVAADLHDVIDGHVRRLGSG